MYIQIFADIISKIISDISKKFSYDFFRRLFSLFVTLKYLPHLAATSIIYLGIFLNLRCCAIPEIYIAQVFLFVCTSNKCYNYARHRGLKTVATSVIS